MCLASTFRNNFQNTEKKNVWKTISILKKFTKSNM